MDLPELAAGTLPLEPSLDVQRLLAFRFSDFGLGDLEPGAGASDLGFGGGACDTGSWLEFGAGDSFVLGCWASLSWFTLLSTEMLYESGFMSSLLGVCDILTCASQPHRQFMYSPTLL